jgi:hypothetical protein
MTQHNNRDPHINLNSPTHIRQWLAALEREGRSPHTVAAYRRAQVLQGKWSFLRNMLKLRRIKGLYNKLLEFGAYLAVTVQKVEVMCRQL